MREVLDHIHDELCALKDYAHKAWHKKQCGRLMDLVFFVAEQFLESR